MFFGRMLAALLSASLTSLLAASAMVMRASVLCAGGSANSTKMGAKCAKIAMVRRITQHDLNRGFASSGAIEIDQRALRTCTFSNIGGGTSMAGTQRFKTGSNTLVQVFRVRSRSFHYDLPIG
jgi:hypothetical protein